VEHLQTLIIMQEGGCQFPLGGLNIIDRFGLVAYRQAMQTIAQERAKK